MSSKGKRWTRLATATVIAGAVAPGIMRWARRAGTRRRTVDLRMTVVVERPIAQVFEFCRDFENFPEVVDLQLDVEDFQDGRSRWTVLSPSGAPITWNATVTKYVPNSVIAWESVAGADVYASGLMRFAPLDARTTRVDITLAYRPQNTALSDALRVLVSPSNERRMRTQLRSASRGLGEGGQPAPEPAAAR
jgi:uncharacterized membrane protein